MLIPVRIGVPTIKMTVEDPTVTLPSLVSVAPTLSAVDTSANGYLVNDLRTPMDLNTDYQFMVGLVGHAANRKGGYAVGYCSQATGIGQLSAANQVFKISIASGSLPTYFDRAVCVVIFSRKGSSSLWKLQDFAYIESGTDFITLVGSDPLAAADSFDVSILRSTTADEVLGDARATNIGVLDKIVRLTQGGVTVNREVSTVNVPIDQAPDFAMQSGRAANIRFNSLANGIRQVVEATGGEYYKVALSGSSDLEIARKTIMTAFAVMKGNRRIVLQMPNEGGFAGEIRAYIGNLFITQAAVDENWQKAATTPISFVLSTAPQDNLLSNQFVELIYRRT